MIYIKNNQIISPPDRMTTRHSYLSFLCHRTSGQGLVQHLYIWMLWKVVQPTKITNELFQLLQKLEEINHNDEGIKN